MPPSFSSTSTCSSDQLQNLPNSPDDATNGSKNHQSDHLNNQHPAEHQNKYLKSAKTVDLDSYFNDLPDQSCSSRSTKRSKPCFTIVRQTRRSFRLRGVPKSRSRRNTTLTVPPSRDEKLEYDSDDDDSEEDSADAAWVRERWNELMDRQRLAEADVRRTILNRNRLCPLELSRWLDSDDTCTLPLPTLGVQLRMIKDD